MLNGLSYSRGRYFFRKIISRFLDKVNRSVRVFSKNNEFLTNQWFSKDFFTFDKEICKWKLYFLSSLRSNWPLVCPEMNCFENLMQSSLIGSYLANVLTMSRRTVSWIFVGLILEALGTYLYAPANGSCSFCRKGRLWSNQYGTVVNILIILEYLQ